MKRTIAVDYRMCRSSGIGVYLRNIVRRLIDDYDDEFRLILLGGEPVAGAFEHRPCNAAIYSPAELIEVPLRVPSSTDVLWSPNYNAPFVSRGRLVVTIHDTCHLALPHFFRSRVKAALSRALFANVRRRAAHVLCDSAFTASEVQRLVGIERERMTVIHCGVNANEFKASASARPVAEPYLLYVGNVKPHKNLGRLLDAFRLLQQHIPHSLIIVGKREGFHTPDRAVILAADSFGDRVRFTGTVSDDALRAHYLHADLLVFPSLYEGFGLPPLEAMASGTPVAASGVTSIPEVCGPAAEYFDPYSAEDMAAAIQRVLRDERLRDRLRREGHDRIQRFSWDVTTSHVAGVLRRVASG